MMDIRDVLVANSLMSDEECTIPYRIAEEGEKGDGKWSAIHDFFHGFGWAKLDDQGEWWHIWMSDIERYQPQWSPDDLWAKYEQGCNEQVTGFSDQELNEMWCRLQPKIEARWRRARTWHKNHPFQFDKITVPNITKPFPEI